MADLTKLGKYEIKRELGKGAMGIVYEGFDPFIERIVAIKTILKSQLDSAEAQDMLNRFRREAQAAGRLAHPNICGIYEYGEDGDVAFIAMEFIKGQELKKMFDEEARFKLPDALKIMSQLLDALNYSHERGVVHRDIKPANIIITESGQVKVADFGIARIESSHLTQAGTVLGTPTHMSPEQFMGLTVDRRSDIYSAGVILYQFLTGERPFTGSVVTIMHKVLNQEPIAPSALNFSVSKSMDEVVRTALAKKPEERYQTAAEFSTALTAAVNDLPGSEGDDADATIAGMGTDPNATVAAGTINTRAGMAKPVLKPMLASSVPAEDQTGFKEKKSSMMVVIVVVVLAVGGAGAWWFTRAPGTPAPQIAAPTAPLTIEQQAEAARLKREKAKAEFDASVKEEEKKLAEVKQERERIALATDAQAKADLEAKAAEDNERAILAKLQQDRKQAEAELAKDKENAEKAKLDLVKAEQLRVAKEKEAQVQMAAAKSAESIAKAKQEQDKLVKEREKAEKAKLDLAKAEQARVEKEKVLVAKREQDLARDLAKAKADKEAAVSKAAAAKVATEKARADAEIAEKKRKVEAEAEAKRKVETDAIAAKNRVAEEADAKRKAAAAAADAKRKAAAAEAEKKTVIASVAPTPAPAAAPAAAPSGGGGGADLFAQGQKHEGDGNLADALKAYTRAANAGYGPAMKKLGDIYGKGNSAVPRDYAASIQWYNKAKQAGSDVSKDTIKR